MTTRPIWQTEQGVFFDNSGVLAPRFATRWASLMAFAQNVLTEDRLNLGTAPYWYDKDHGFDAIPTFACSDIVLGGCMGPQMIPTRTIASEIWNKTFVAELDFGTYGRDLYIGGKWRDSDGVGVVGIQAASYGLPDIRLAVTGASTVVHVDAWGNTTTLTVSGGHVTFPAHELPGWVRLPNGVDADLVPADWSWGTNYTPQGTNPSPQVVVTTTGSRTKLHYLSEEILRNQFDYGISDPTDVTAPFTDTTGAWDGTGFPITITWDYRRVITLDKIVLHSFPPWQFIGTLLDFDIDTSPDGTTWTTRYTHAAPPIATLFQSNPWRSNYERFWDEQHIFAANFSAASIRYVRLVCRSASTGHLSLAEQQWIYSLAATQQPTVCIRALETFWTAGSNTPFIGGGASFSPLDIGGLRLWLDAQDSTSLVQSGGKVSKWYDNSTWGSDVSQATDANRPTTGSAINGHPALSFNGAGQYLQKLDFGATGGLNLGTVFIVAQETSDASGATSLLWIDGNTSAGVFINSHHLRYLQSGGQDQSVASVSDGVGFVGSIVISGTSGKIAIDGNTTAGLTLGPCTLNDLHVGLRAGASWLGLIGEILIYIVPLNDTDRQTVEAYLKAKWGTP